MAKITLEVSDEEYKLLEQDADYMNRLLLRVVSEALAGKKSGRSEWVKAMTRLKTPVVNWEDLEEQILKGSIGEKSK